MRSVFLSKEPIWNNKRLPYIYLSGEIKPPQINQRHKDCISLLTAMNKMPNVIYCPFISQSPYLAEEGKIRLYTNNNRPFKVAYCCSRCLSFRQNVFRKFAKKNKHCYALGNCCGKMHERKRKVPGKWRDEGLIRAYSQFDFVLAMENTVVDGYITEKIMNAYAAGAIPIYRGTSAVKKFFNSASYVNLLDYKSVDKCVDHVLGMNEEDIQKMRCEPIYNLETDKDILDIIQAFTGDNKYYKGVAERIYEMCNV